VHQPDVTGFAGRIEWDTTKPNGQPRRSVDGTRARELFGFEAKTSLRDGLEGTGAWYREQCSRSPRLAANRHALVGAAPSRG
jgi:GDP-L-fucose synthase